MGSKGKGRRGHFQPDRSAVMKQVQQLQEQILQTQQALADETVSASVGGGAVTVVMTGQQEVHEVIIDPEVVDRTEVEMLQDLVMAAVNEALAKSRQLAEERMGPLTGALSIPGLM